jgi:DNA helicase-2/ATP-dependent DNA helicase PcrA
VLDDLTDDQRRAVVHERGPLLVLAGAGSGKTGVLSRRLAWLVGERGIPPNGITALTYTRAAAEELRRRAEEMIGDVHETLRVGTFHSFAGELLRGLGEDEEVEQVGEEERRMMLTELLPGLGLISHDLRGTGEARVVTDFIRLIDRCRDELIDAESYLRWAEAARDGARSREERLAALRQVEFARAFVAHDERLRDNGQADFGMTIHRALDRLRGDERARAKAAERARHIVVDEFQDVNFALSEVLHLLGGSAESFVAVGDDDQAIYRFRGASTQNLTHFREHFPDHEQVTLRRNFRSHQAILDAAGAIVADIGDRVDKELEAAPGASGPTPRFWVAPGPEAQAHAVVSEIARLEEEGVPLHEQAIVMRAVRTESRSVTEALDAAGIPYQVRGGTGLFERREARQALAWLRMLADPRDAQAHLRVASDPDLGLPYAAAVDVVASREGPYTGALVELARSAGREDAADLIEELGALVVNESPRAAVRGVLERTGLRPRAAALGGAEGSARLQGLAQVERLALEVLERDSGLEFGALVARLSGLADQGVRLAGGSDQRAGVQVTTIHSAKGLEYDAVFFIGLTRRNLPGSERNRLEIPDQLLQEVVPSGEAAHDAEMRRLAYVAMTRARTHLYLVRPSENSRGWTEQPSPFFRQARLALDAPEESVGAIPPPPLEEIEAAKGDFERACQVAVVARGEARDAARRGAEEAARRLIDLRMGQGEAPAAPAPAVHEAPPPPSIAVTPTALTDYIGCPLRYRFGRVDRIPAPDDAQRRGGTAGHDALEEHYAPDGGGDGQRLLERIESHLERAGVASTAAGQHALDRARHVIPPYHEAHGEPAEVVDTELELTMPLGSHHLRMRVDRVDAVGERAVRVVDYKTASRPKGRIRPDDALPLTLYAVAVGRRRGGEVQAAFHYVLDRDPVATVVVDGPEVDDQLQSARTAADGIAAGEFDAKPGWHCQTCDFQLICPAVER